MSSELNQLLGKIAEIRYDLKLAELDEAKDRQFEIHEKYFSFWKDQKEKGKCEHEKELLTLFPVRQGDWVCDGRVLEYVGYPFRLPSSYFIQKKDLTHRPLKSFWLQHLGDKVWYNSNPQCESDFVELFDFVTKEAAEELREQHATTGFHSELNCIPGDKIDACPRCEKKPLDIN